MPLGIAEISVPKAMLLAWRDAEGLKDQPQSGIPTACVIERPATSLSVTSYTSLKEVEGGLIPRVEMEMEMAIVHGSCLAKSFNRQLTV